MNVFEIVNTDLYKLYLLSQLIKNRRKNKKIKQQMQKGRYNTVKRKKVKPVKKQQVNRDFDNREPYDTREPFVSNREPYDTRER